MSKRTSMPPILVEIRAATGHWRCATCGLVYPPCPLIRVYTQERRVFARACLSHPLLTFKD